MILASVDDLLFASKIRTIARQSATEVTFVKNPDELFALARRSAPTLVIFDLNNERSRPLETLETMKADPMLASVTTLGFVSHVDSNLIAAARRAGIDEVVARSAFSARLGEILAR